MSRDDVGSASQINECVVYVMRIDYQDEAVVQFMRSRNGVGWVHSNGVELKRISGPQCLDRPSGVVLYLRGVDSRNNDTFVVTSQSANALLNALTAFDDAVTEYVRPNKDGETVEIDGRTYRLSLVS